MMKKWILAGMCLTFLGLGACATDDDDVSEPDESTAGARSPKFEIEYTYFSSEDMTTEVGGKTYYCHGLPHSWGDTSPYSTKVRTPCEPGSP